MAERYTYRALDNERSEIRLLAFEPHSHVPWEPQPSPIRCRVKYIGFNDDTTPPYNAVSYCWGESRALRQIFLDGKLHEVPESADIALRSLGQRVEVLDTLIWIDAVCIDQENLHEKSQQVSLMADIYSGAETVLIWLGESDDSTPSAIQSLYSIVEYYEPHEVGITSDRTADGLEGLPSPPHCNWASIAQFFTAAWFTRTWVLQECKLAKRALCHRGNHIVPWDTVAEAARMMVARGSIGQYFPLKSTAYGLEFRGLTATALLQSTGSSMTLSMFVAFVWMNTFTDCTDPKDRIYAHLGWLNRAKVSSQLPAIDYTRSLESTYTSATRVMMNTDRMLEPLAYAPETKPDSAEFPAFQLPSWVPRYDRLSGRGACTIGVGNMLHEDAISSVDCEFTFNDYGILHASGISLGRVTFVGCQVSSLPTDSSALSEEDWEAYFTIERLQDGMLAPWDAAFSQGSCRSTKDPMEMASLLSLGKYEPRPESNLLADFAHF